MRDDEKSVSDREEDYECARKNSRDGDDVLGLEPVERCEKHGISRCTRSTQ